MELQDRIDQAVGEPQVRVDPARTVALGRRRARRDRGLAAGAAMLAVGAVVGGLIWSNRPAPLQVATEPRSVTVTTCAANAMPPGGEDDARMMVMVTGPASVCVSPEDRVVEKIDHPIGGHTSVALDLASDGDRNTYPVVVVWGAFGLDESWGIPLITTEEDMLDAVSGKAGDPEPLETFVAKVRREPLDAAPGRAKGWQHCPGGDTPLWVQDGTVCVGEDFEVVNHASLDRLAQQMIEKVPGTPSDSLDLEALRGQEFWELVDRSGQFYYVLVDATKPDSQPHATRLVFHAPLYLVAGLLTGGPESSQGSEESAESSTEAVPR